MAVGKFDVELHAGVHLGCLPQRTTFEITHQRKAARKHAAMGERGQQLPAALKRRDAVSKQELRRTLAALGQRGDAFALPVDAIAMDVGIRP